MTNSASIEELARRFGSPELQFETGLGGLPRIRIRTCSAFAELYLHGAHVTAWQPVHHDPVLWMSEKSHYSPDKPIRGGVPICFPWFGPHPQDTSKPAHGYARLVDWNVVKADVDDKGTAELHLQTLIAEFHLEFRLTTGNSLTMELVTRLADSAQREQTFEEALHTYFSVADIRNVTVSGLESDRYIDKVANASRCPASGTPIRFDSETDRVYLDTEAPCVLTDPGRRRHIVIRKQGSRSTVVWNPWIDKSARMQDFGDEEWPAMVCIETANAGDNAVTLEPGQSHRLKAEIEVSAC